MSMKNLAPFGFWNGAPNGAKSAPFKPGAPKGNGNGAKARHSLLPMAQRSLATPFLWGLPKATAQANLGSK